MLGVHSFSEPGGHRHNEDAYRVQPHPLDPDCWLCFVADGQGGRAGGGPAAQLACQTAIAAALGCRPVELARPSTWTDILRQADEAVGNPELRERVAALVTMGLTRWAEKKDKELEYLKSIERFQFADAW